MHTFLLVLLALATAQVYDAPLYSRMIVMARNAGNITNTAADVLDLGHQKMKDVGYTQAQIDTLETGAYNFFRTQFGLNFSAGFPSQNIPGQPPGGVVLPVAFNGTTPTTFAVMVPYANRPDAGLRYHIAFDSAHEDRTKNVDWYIRDFGMIVLYIGPGRGTFNGGVMQGTTWNNGSVLFYGDYNYLKVGGNYADPNCNCKEIFHVSSYVPSTQIPNSQGYNDNTIKFRVVDEQGRTGLILVFIHVFVEPDGTVNQRIRGLVTFDCPTGSGQIPPVLCPSPQPAPQPAPEPVPLPEPAPTPICDGSAVVNCSLLLAILALFARFI